VTDPRDEIERIIEQAEAAAFQRGWDAAVASITESAKRLRPNMRAPEMAPATIVARPLAPQRGRPQSKAIQVVEDCIAATPGMRGVDVVQAAQSVDAAIKERTVRTCLRRLRMSKVIWQRNGLWYPKTKEKPENVSGEAVGSPPH
jgi:hypothetical protein